jgi:hypothetical protein
LRDKQGRMAGLKGLSISVPGHLEIRDRPTSFQVASGKMQSFTKGSWGGEFRDDLPTQS